MKSSYAEKSGERDLARVVRGLMEHQHKAMLKRLVAGGAQLRPFPQPVMDASLRAALDVYAEVSNTNPDFKKVWEALLAFRNDEYLWWQVAELTYDNYLVRNRTRT